MKSISYFFIFLSFVALQSCGDSKLKLNDAQQASVAGSAASGSSEETLKIDMSAASIAKGKAQYETTCSPCHGLKGKGDGPAAAAFNPKPRDHSNGAYMDKLTNRHIYNVIKMGGTMYGYPTMPAQPQLSDDQIVSVIAYVRTLSSTYRP